MSTRATVHFINKGQSTPEAIIYRHGDGYPDGLGKDLENFIAEVRKLQDTRLSDASYLAAKWVVWDAANYGNRSNYDKATPLNPLNFLSVGVVRQDTDDIEYRYKVVCDGTPTITCETV